MKTGPGAAKRNKQFSDYEVLLLGSGVSSVVRVPDLRLKGHGFESAGTVGEFFFSRVNFCVDSYSGICSSPVLPQ